MLVVGPAGLPATQAVGRLRAAAGIAGVTHTADPAVAAAAAGPCDVVILLHRPERGFDAFALAPRVSPGGAAVTLIVADELPAPDMLCTALDAGCAGVVTSAEAAALPDLVHRACAGESLFSTPAIALMRDELRRRAIERFRLTRREIDVLTLLARGTGTVEIAERLHLQPPTVRNYIQTMLDKMGASNRVQAVVFGVREGIVSAGAARVAEAER